ncbi:1,2-phenylacetyl-CoA epoxidase subunit PaaC [Actinoplanes sp. NPDC026670]|uniref:1,2-phenylacetyl-CoA epoxidase subunit PaaC n=1 Tax=Actinoplanes sp. NPDC026670 TaxID=3154700 RepID=UPI0033E94ABA
MAFDDAYDALTDHEDDARWAYGTGFSDPLAGVAADLPDGVDRADLAAYCLMLGDDALILSHRLQQWVTRAPELEDELALANIGLDLLGQARLLLTRAGVAEDRARDEDELAMRRAPAEFRNVRLAERSDDDFAHLVARLCAFSVWRLELLQRLSGSRDPMLAAIAAKGVKEVTYHRDYAAQWVVRLGDGTELSHQRMVAAVDALTPLLGELFEPHPVESRLAAAGVAVDPGGLRAAFDEVWAYVLTTATLGAAATPVPAPSHEPAAAVSSAPASSAPASSGPGSSAPGSSALVFSSPGSSVFAGGRDGVHGPELGEILDEMQGLARSVSGGAW